MYKQQKYLKNLLGSKPSLPPQFLLGRMSSWACSEASKSCTWHGAKPGQHTPRGNNVSRSSVWWLLTLPEQWTKKAREQTQEESVLIFFFVRILAERAIVLTVTLSGGALFANWKLYQIPSSLIVKVIIAFVGGRVVSSLKGCSSICFEMYGIFSGMFHFCVVKMMWTQLDDQCTLDRLHEGVLNYKPAGKQLCLHWEISCHMASGCF